jgi:hypothetical protein
MDSVTLYIPPHLPQTIYVGETEKSPRSPYSLETIKNLPYENLAQKMDERGRVRGRESRS